MIPKNPRSPDADSERSIFVICSEFVDIRTVFYPILSKPVSVPLASDRMAAVVIVRRHRGSISTDVKEAITESFVENLPPDEVREVDTVMGTLLLG